MVNESTSLTSPFFLNFTSLPSGTYYYNATVNDSAGNLNITLTRNVTVNLPPAINSNITAPLQPVETDEVRIIGNVTDDNDNILWVNFSVWAPNASLIVDNRNASFQDGELYHSSSFNITAPGTWIWNITAFDGVSETKAQGSFTIAVWHTIVGNLSGSFVLGDSYGASLVRWDVANSTGSNVYVTDSDSNLNFGSLLALGRDTSNNSRPEDFSELDSLLSIENLSDSVNRTFTTSSTPLDEYNFSVFSQNIYYVPIANSTNSSTFYTGILWDTTLDNNGQFDPGDKEDVVFITEVVTPQYGKYGYYQFEISIPAALRRYREESSDAVAIYGEIT
jgi:hypothetical protein